MPNTGNMWHLRYLHVFSVYSGRGYTCQWILCYLSELVVLERSSANLYLEAKVVGPAH